MNLEGILYISGKQGLFKIVSTSKNKIIIENLSCIIPKLIDQKNIENANSKEIK